MNESNIDISKVRRDKDGFYIEVNIRTRLPVYLQVGNTRQFVYDVEGYMQPDIGLSWLYKLLDSYWRKDTERPIKEVDQRLIDRFFNQWYQLETFRFLGLKDYPILIKTTKKKHDAVPYIEFEEEKENE
jgi:hypothetical protein